MGGKKKEGEIEQRLKAAEAKHFTVDSKVIFY